MGLEQLFTWPVIFFGLFIYFVTLSIRRAVKAKWPKIEENNAWRGAFLPALPALVGVVLTFALTKQGVISYPLPEIVLKSATAKVMFGGTTGFLSGSVYQIFKALVKKNFNVDIGSSPPPGPAPAGVVPPSADVPVTEEEPKL